MIHGFRRLAPLAAALAVTVAIAAPSVAATPGKNGRIVALQDGDLVTMDADPATDDTPQVLVPAADAPDDPVWSPDGTRIAYIALAGPVLQVFVMNADGTGKVQVTHEPCDNGEVDWSPDGQWLVFSPYDCDARHSSPLASEQIAKIRIDGTGRVALTAFKQDRYDFDPAWSPDGRTIAFSSGLSGDRLTLIDANGKNRRIWSENAYYQSWSPDGKRLIYGKDSAGPTDDFFIKPVSGGTAVPISLGNFPQWSPDGRWIVFSKVDSGDYTLWITRSDGSGIAQQINAVSAQPGVPHWQPLCSLKGNDKGNTLTGTAKSELICGFGGKDTIDGKGGLDIVIAGDGDDTVKGGPGNDVLLGGKGDDRLDGSTGVDQCRQGPGTGPLISC